MSQPQWVTDATTRLLEHLHVHAVDVLTFVQDGTIKAWDEWDAALDDSYQAGRELVLGVPNSAYAQIEGRLAEVQAPLRSAARAAGLAYLRIDAGATELQLMAHPNATIPG
jgi:hypothetical protein